MNPIKLAISCIIVLVVSYMPVIGAYYIHSISNSKTSTPFFLKNFTLKETPTELLYSLNLENYANYETLSLGVVSPPPTIYCDKKLVLQNSVNASQFEKNTNTIIGIPKSSSCNTLEIEFKKQIGYPTFGQISGMAFFSDQQNSTNYKRIIDFFSRDIRIFLLIIVLLYIYFRSYEKFISSRSIEEDLIERHSLSWGLFLISSSGILEAFFPQISSGVLSRLNTYFSAIAHLAPGIDLVLMLAASKIKRPPLTIYFLLFSYILFSDERIYALSAVGVPIGLIALSACIFLKSELKYFFYCVLLLLNFSKLLGLGTPVFLPHIHLVSIYVGALMLQSTLLRIRLVGKITSAAYWQSTHASNSEITIQQILERMAETAGFGKVSYLSIGQGVGKCEISTFRKTKNANDYTVHQFNDLPPVFAAVIASGEQLWHEDDSSSRSDRLKKGNKKFEVGKFYSIIPVFIDSAIVGALAVTNYKLSNDVRMAEFYKKIVSSFSAHLEKALKISEEKKKLLRHEGLIGAKRYLNAFSGFRDNPSSLKESINFLANNLSCGFMVFSKTKTNEFAVILTSGIAPVVETQARDLVVKENELNEHGPFPLSLRSKKPVFINQTALLKEVLSTRTLDFLNLSEAKSLAVIPILNLGAHRPNHDLTKVIMVINKNEDFFNSQIQELLKSFSAAIDEKESLCQALEMVKVQSGALANFVPDEVSQNLMNNQSTRLESHGYLACLDLIGSTKFLGKFGDERFLNEMSVFTENVKQQLPKLNLQIFTTNWDAIYIHSENLENIIKFYKDLPKISEKGFLVDGKCEVGFRICVSYGNTSRDFSEAEGFRRWTVVGPSMAEVCKFEESVKHLGTGLYINGKVFHNLTDLKSQQPPLFEMVTLIDGTKAYFLTKAIRQATIAA